MILIFEKKKILRICKILEIEIFGMRGYSNLGIKERGGWDLRNLLIWNFGYLSDLIFYDLGFWNYGILEIWKFEISAISKNLIVCDYDDLKFEDLGILKCGNLKTWDFRNMKIWDFFNL